MATNFKDRPMPVFRNLYNYTMFAPAIEEGGKQARLSVSFMDNRPRFTLYTNVSTDEHKGIASVGYYADLFFGILDEFDKVLDMEPGMMIPIRNYTDVRTDEGKRTGEKIIASQLNFGKDETGVLYLQLVAQGRTKFKFQFKLSDYHQIFTADKKPFTEEEGSKLVARGWLKGVRAACENVCSTLMPEQVAQTGTRPVGSKPSPATSSASMLDFDDDIPM